MNYCDEYYKLTLVHEKFDGEHIIKLEDPLQSIIHISPFVGELEKDMIVDELFKRHLEYVRANRWKS